MLGIMNVCTEEILMHADMEWVSVCSPFSYVLVF